MSDVEKFYEAARLKCGSQRTWNQLHPQEQMMFIQAVNLINQVLFNDTSH
jgi:hypothetical protein